MCTVTYIPQPEGSFILTSNRDESPLRSPENLSMESHHGRTLLFPKDKGAGGSWIAASDDNRVACVLNGAFVKHKHQPPYRKSRGLMLVEYFGFPSVNDFAKRYDFEGIEPFTLILVEGNKPFEIRWDGRSLHHKILEPNEMHIWSSATLYPPEVQEKRLMWFNRWKEEASDFSLESIRAFHLHGGEPDPWNGFVMNRNDKVRTVSVTSVVQEPDGFEMIYGDLLRNTEKRMKLAFREALLRARPSH